MPQLQHSRSLRQAYTYDDQGRLEYTPANGVIGSYDFQVAFDTAILNLTATGMVLTPAGSYQVPFAKLCNLSAGAAKLGLCESPAQA